MEAHLHAQLPFATFSCFCFLDALALQICVWASLYLEVHSCCRLIAGSMQGLPETSNSMMNSMLTAMRSGISAVGRRMGVNLPLPLRKMLEGQLTLVSVGNLHINLLSPLYSASPARLLSHSDLLFMH